jgi:hypothetical protein
VEDDHAIVSRIILHETYLDAFFSERAVQRLSDEFSRSAEIAAAMKSKASEPKIDDIRGFTGSLAEQILKGEKEPALKVHCEDGKDPVVTICMLLRELTGKDGISSRSDPTTSFKDQVERTVRSIKGSDGMIPRSTLAHVLGEISSRGAKALESLRRISNSGRIDGDELTNELRKALFYILSHSLVRTEMVSRWSDPAVSAWDDLRIERQRTIKSSVQSVMDTVTMITDIYSAASGRWEAYLANTSKRKEMETIKNLTVSSSPGEFKGMAGETWSLLMTIRSPKYSTDIELTPHISLPGSGWTLELPRSVREGERFVLRTFRMKGGERKDIELKVRSPSSPVSGEDARIYLFCSGLELEEET